MGKWQDLWSKRLSRRESRCPGLSNSVPTSIPRALRSFLGRTETRTMSHICPDAAPLTRWQLVATFKPMRSVGIKVLNSRLSEYVRLAATGETILVTDRDRVVAEIGPPRESRSPILADALLADAVRKGWLTPPPLPFAGTPPVPEPVAPLDEVLAELEGDRSER